jgi:hypothetical protein
VLENVKTDRASEMGSDSAGYTGDGVTERLREDDQSESR